MKAKHGDLMVFGVFGQATRVADCDLGFWVKWNVLGGGATKAGPMGEETKERWRG